MATIEVHDGQGRVQFVGLSRDHPLLFGTSAACDVVLEGEGIRPVHGRIRWKSKRFKIEASPDAQFVLINGHKMTTGSVHQGDEITVGPCRMFLLKVDDDMRAESGSKSQADEGRTKVLPSPFAGDDRDDSIHNIAPTTASAQDPAARPCSNGTIGLVL